MQEGSGSLPCLLEDFVCSPQKPHLVRQAVDRMNVLLLPQ